MKTTEVHLGVPEYLSYQLVYRQERSAPFTVAPRDDATFHLLAAPADARPLLAVLKRALGPRGLVQTLAKLATARRLFYCMVSAHDVVHHAWLTVGFCRHYWVAPEDVVIGPINTLEAWRGKGLAVTAMERAMNAMLARGHRVFFIDTTDDNRASQRAIAKCGFGVPVASYLRGYRVQRPFGGEGGAR